MCKYVCVYHLILDSIQRVESVESTTSSEKKNITVQYYYINYKVFVNVVKYKLHRIREKIRSDERKVTTYMRVYVIYFSLHLSIPFPSTLISFL